VVKADQRARGRYLGGIAPFGYAVATDGALEAQPDQQAAIAHMRVLRLAARRHETLRRDRCTILAHEHKRPPFVRA
jgi:hypothetical protein